MMGRAHILFYVYYYTLETVILKKQIVIKFVCSKKNEKRLTSQFLLGQLIGGLVELSVLLQKLKTSTCYEFARENLTSFGII